MLEISGTGQKILRKMILVTVLIPRQIKAGYLNSVSIRTLEYSADMHDLHHFSSSVNVHCGPKQKPISYFGAGVSEFGNDT